MVIVYIGIVCKVDNAGQDLDVSSHEDIVGDDPVVGEGDTSDLVF